MKRLFIIALLFLLSAQSSFAQKEIYGDEEFWDRTYFGGNFGLSFGSNNLNVEISPEMGYMFTDHFSSGLGVIFQYNKYTLELSNGKDVEFDSKIFGGRFFSRYNITDELFARAELEVLQAPYWDIDTERKKDGTSIGTFVGGGYYSNGFAITALYNLSHDLEKSPYGEPYVIRIGFYF